MDDSLPKVYDPSTDEMIDATQDWCDTTASYVQKLAKKIEIIKLVCGLHPIKDDKAFIAIQHAIQNKDEL